jgi:hypothetical protein
MKTCHCLVQHYSGTVRTNLLPAACNPHLLVSRLAWGYAIITNRASYGGERGKERHTPEVDRGRGRGEHPYRRVRRVYGKLKEVNDAGIVVSFTVQKDGKDYGRTVFYPWQTVNWIRMAEDKPL